MKKHIITYIIISFLLGCGDENNAENLMGDSCSSSSDNCISSNICINNRCENIYDVNYDIKVDKLTINNLNYWSGENFEVIMNIVYGNTQNTSRPCSTRIAARLSERGEFSGENFEDYYGERISRDGCRLEQLRDGDSLNITVRNLAFFDWVIFTCTHELNPRTIKERRLLCTGGDEGTLSLTITPQSINITNN